MSGIRNAQDLVDQLQKIAKTHGVELKDLEVNFRQNFNSDVHQANWLAEDTFEGPEETLAGVIIYNDDEGDDDCNFSD